MTKRFAEKKLVIASHNVGKVIEINELLTPFGVEGVAAGDLGLQEPVEDGLTFIANAMAFRRDWSFTLRTNCTRLSRAVPV